MASKPTPSLPQENPWLPLPPDSARAARLRIAPRTVSSTSLTWRRAAACTATSHSTCWRIRARVSYSRLGKFLGASSMRLCARRASQISVSATKHCAPAVDSRRSASRIVLANLSHIFSFGFHVDALLASANASGGGKHEHVFVGNAIDIARALLYGERGAKRDRSAWARLMQCSEYRCNATNGVIRKGFS